MDYREIIEILGRYKDESCKLVENRCDRCEAGQKYRGNTTCSFDTVCRFVEWEAIYNRKIDSFKQYEKITKEGV